MSSVSEQEHQRTSAVSFISGAGARRLVPLCVGAGTYLLLLLFGDNLLNDPDTLWQIKVGQWILDHHALPHTDVYSLTRLGAPWISTSWLSQVLYDIAYIRWEWAGPVILAALAAAAATGILVYLLNAQLSPSHAVLFTLLALVLSMQHLLARPHVLALPVMVAWTGALMSAADRRASPSLLSLPLMVLWANLHGGFVLGIALIGPIGLEALWSAAPARRIRLALRWSLFGLGALAAGCCTPYGWHTLMGAANILSLGKLLSVISEWRPADFSSFSLFAGALLALIAFAFRRGLVLSPPRILLVLALTYMALAHARSVEAFGFLVPLVLAKPLRGRPKPAERSSAGEAESRPVFDGSALAAIAIVAAAWASTSFWLVHHRFAFSTVQTPIAAVDLLEQRGARRIFNSYGFGGYLIARDLPPFVDGRTELYGETFLMEVFRLEEARDVTALLRMLDEYGIDATLLEARAPAAQVLDHLPGWRRLYADDIAIVHVRTNQAATDRTAGSAHD